MKEILKEYESLLVKFSKIEDKIRMLNKLSEDLERKKPLHSLALSEYAFDLAVKIGFEEGAIKSLIQTGRSLWLTGDLGSALEKLFEGLSRTRAINHLQYEVEILNAIGNVNLYLKIYDRALEYYNLALNIAKAIKYEKLIAGLLNNLGELHYRLHDYFIALKYYLDSLKKFKELNDDQLLITVPLLNIGGVHLALKEYNEAEKYLHKCLVISKQINDGLGASSCYHLLGKLAFENNNKDEAFKHYQKSIQINRDVGDVFLDVGLFIDIYHYYKELGQLDKGIEYLQKALQSAEKIKATDFISQCCSLLATTHDQLGDVEQAIYYYRKYHDQTKSITESENESKLRSIVVQIKAEESQRKNKAFEIMTAELEQKTHELSRSYTQMKIISEIGQTITATLNVDKVFKLIYKSINSLMDATVLGIGLYNKEKDVIEYKLYIEEGENAPAFDIPLSSKSSFAVWCFNNKKEIMINDTEQEYPSYLEGIKSTVGKVKSSLIFCPLILNEKIIGVVTVQSNNKNAYNQHDLDAIRALVSYIVIAINNAEKSENLAKEIASREESQEELEELNQKLIKLSEFDSLTDIPNRRRFDYLYYEEWKRAIRDQLPISVVLIDVDQFKQYNDHYGHQEGDRVLCEVAQALQDVPKRSSDFVARYGGDEFVAVLPNTDEEGAKIIAEKMLKSIASLQIKHYYSKIANHVTVTIGTATDIPKLNMDAESLLRNADSALYQAKENGRNCVVHFQQE